jgi:hypothetical protein
VAFGTGKVFQKGLGTCQSDNECDRTVENEREDSGIHFSASLQRWGLLSHKRYKSLAGTSSAISLDSTPHTQTPTGNQ